MMTAQASGAHVGDAPGDSMRAMPCHIGRKRWGTRGLALVELTLVLALLTLLAVWGVQTQVDRMRDAAAQASGTWLVEIRHGVLQMLGSHFDALAKGESPRAAAGQALFTDPRHPDLEALKRAGHLPASFPTRSAMGFSAKVVVLRDRRCPGEGCRLDALVYTDVPVLDRGAVDSMGIAQMLMATQGWGAQVAARASGRLVGAAVDMPNPVEPGAPAWPVGTVAAWAGLDRESTRQYLRVGDTRDPAFQGSVTVAGNLQGASVHSRSDVRADGTVVSAEDIISGRSVLARNLVHVGQTVIVGSACEDTGALGRDAAGQVAACVAGRWQTPTDGFGGAYGRNSKHGCQMFGGESMRNPRTGDCSCPAGYQAVPIAEGGRWYERGGYTFGYICIR